MSGKYFSEREGIIKAKETTYKITIDSYEYLFNICKNYFNYLEKFAGTCPDGNIACGIDYNKLNIHLKQVIPEINIDNYGILIKPNNEKYNLYAILDFIEFIFKYIKDASNKYYHEYYRHKHFIFIDSSKYIQDKFRTEINKSFIEAGLLFTINDKGIINRIIKNDVIVNDIEQKIENIKKKDLQELISDAIKYHKSKNQDDWKISTEKIWDAFENIKTYYSCDKKESIVKIIEAISQNEEDFKVLINNEFETLTKIGNKYRIRHFETGKKEIKDLLHYDYLFNRCLSIMNLTLPYLK